MGKVDLNLGVELVDVVSGPVRNRTAIANILGKTPLKVLLRDQRVACTQLSIADSATTTLNLQSLVNLFDVAAQVNIGAVRGIVLVNTGVHAVLWGGAASDGFVGFAATATRRVAPAANGQPSVDIAYSAAGLPVTGSTSDISITNTGGTAATCFLLLFGDPPE